MKNAKQNKALEKTIGYDLFKNRIITLFIQNNPQIEPDLRGIKVTDDQLLAWVGLLANAHKLPTLGIDEFHDLVAEISAGGTQYLAGLFMEMGDFEDIEDGQYEEISDAIRAIARLIARNLGFPLANMDPAFLHVIERELAEYNKPVCPATCEFVDTCTDKPKFHHIKSKEDCVVWHLKDRTK